jgi:hypothetical protein
LRGERSPLSIAVGMNHCLLQVGDLFLGTADEALAEIHAKHDESELSP